MNMVLFVNSTIGFSENLFLVIYGSYGGHRRHTTYDGQQKTDNAKGMT